MNSYKSKHNLISKTYECKNFEYPFIKINNYDNGVKYSLNFLNNDKKSIKTEIYQKNVPESLIKLFNLDINESNKGFITEITCVNSMLFTF